VILTSARKIKHEICREICLFIDLCAQVAKTC